MLRLLLWSLAGLFSVLLTALAFLPATWMASVVETQSSGRFTLGDAQGTLWSGSAFIGGASGSGDPVTPLLPGRFSWHLSPLVLLGGVDLELANPEAMEQPVRITGSWNRWHVSPTVISLPAERLAALGAPLNTVQPSGRMQLSWAPLQLGLHEGAIEISGTMNLKLIEISSRMSPVKPLGDYNLTLDWQGQNATALLNTNRGPMLLNGSGRLSNGHLQFSGTAQAEAGQEERLENFLNLLGQRRRENDRDVIALEFK
ncbi:MAG TPA: type II secretion system protein N [Gallionella sp.]